MDQRVNILATTSMIMAKQSNNREGKRDNKKQGS
jgi:hypothetical protein